MTNMKQVLSLIAAAGFGALAVTATGFANPKDDDETNSEAPDPRIGEEVRSICFQSSINGWRALKGEDDVVLLNRGVNDWYRVELLGVCRWTDFRSALAIGIESRPAGGCVTRGDVIIVEDGPGFNRRCTITKIYEWDDDAGEESDEEEDSET